MSSTVHEPAHPPTRSPVRPAAPLDPETATGEREVSFEIESPGGYRRAVVGTIAYFDDEAQTYLVCASDGKLLRVSLRNIKKASGAPSESSEIEARRSS